MIKVKQPVLLTMLQETLRNDSPVVRAEMIRSLIYCRMDPNIVRKLQAVYEDKSELDLIAKVKWFQQHGITPLAG